MTALNKQALREAAQEEIMLRSVSDTSDAWQDEASPEAVLALLDENLQLQRDKDSLEAVAITMRDDMREAREKLEAAEKRIAELDERTPYGYLRQCDGQIQISIGREQPHNRSGGYATPWFAIYTAAGISVKGE